MSFTPKTRLEKILCGVAAEARTRLEKAVQAAIKGRALTVEGTAGEGTLTLGMTAGELYEAVAAGKTVVSESALGEGSYATFAININAFKLTDNGTDAYYFVFMDQEGDVVKSVGLSADAPVVMNNGQITGA